MKNQWYVITTLVSLLTASICFADLRVDPSLPPATQSSLQQLVLDVENRLPPVMVNALKSKTILVTAQKTSQHIAGNYQNGKISISSDLLNSNNGDLIQRTIVHELSHVYDFLNIEPDYIIQKQNWCRDQLSNRDNTNNGLLKSECKDYTDIQTTVSTQPRFMNLMSYWKAGGLNKTYERMNFLESRSPDPYEWKNLQEAFAVNMEYFITDPEYKCRRPSQYTYLSEHFQGFAPFPNGNCQMTSAVLVAGSGVAHTQGRFSSTTNKKLYQIHYLWAGVGDSEMSRFGHSMYRLVFCAPERKAVGPECLEDVKYHLVVSFAAAVEDFQINAIKGLNGSYPSVEFIGSLSQLITQYNSREMRDLYSLPLNLTEAEKMSVLRSIVDLQWTYEGKYKFVSNNCADEAIHLLKLALPKNQAVQGIDAGRPDTLYSKLIELKLGDDSIIKDHARAVSMGLIFESKRPLYEKSLGFLKSGGVVAADMKLDDFFDKSTAQSRQAMLSKLSNDPRTRQVQVASMIVLEDVAYMRLQKKLISEVLAATNGGKNVASSQTIDDVKTLARFFRSPSTLLDKQARYGIPSPQEVTRIDNNPEFIEKGEEAAQYSKDLDGLLAQYGAKETMDQIRTSQQIQEQLRQFMK